MSGYPGFVQVAAHPDATGLALDRAALEAADIPVVVNGALTGALPMRARWVAPATVWVPEARAAEARRLLDAIREGTVSAEDPDAYADHPAPDWTPPDPHAPRPTWAQQACALLAWIRRR
ncbi:DUF2007 domain-containing protein [Jannaschia sp. Os4]|uniref:putative signal transducing protein n=1 Tax=Jannaschia sp. Os4 TaxID=2807617 RepID=UPI001939584C|nr:DUF2007 domain-containing protein [Jannaschia sp. Os4]MBM2576031.1 DUF2007 domain-containing protein [Jannaschia sp. Os4]